ncbi:MAG: DNA polymerase Y family protein [Alphaproteobacteria bacterium]|jgi:DNA polymerase-4|tara:strand:+ start:4640 stop:5842 length:1203 start_codon:yes stop_codon:yes gene_type:complete
MTIFRTLYVDMDSFFASVEKQLDPFLRKKPVGITAVNQDSGCIVAASYEAKAYGVKTGTRVYEAKILCPNILLRESRHKLYVRYNQKIASILDGIAELEKIRSIDEFQIALGGDSARLKSAISLAVQMKLKIKELMGPEITLSIGIASNPLLAKIASKLDKPDGLQWLSFNNMPQKIRHLDLDDLPGISRGLRLRLWKAGVYDIQSLYNLDPAHARIIWKSIEGERFVRSLRGENIPIGNTIRRRYGNSKVLSPEYRSIKKAYLVGRWLIEKSSERLRKHKYCSGRLDIIVRTSSLGTWADSITFTPSQNTFFFLEQFANLWDKMIDSIRPLYIDSLGVHFSDIIFLKDRSAEFFISFEAGKQNKKEKLSSSIDNLNFRYGKRVVKFGIHKEHPGFFEKG